jgi:hypothetical protein
MDREERFRMALLFPMLAVITIVAYAGGLGVIFMLVNETALKEWGVMIIGVSLVVGIPTVAAIAQMATERK